MHDNIANKIRLFEQMEPWIPGIIIIQQRDPFQNLYMSTKGCQMFGITPSFFNYLPQLEFRKLIFDDQDPNTCLIGDTKKENGDTEKEYYIREVNKDGVPRVDLIINHRLLFKDSESSHLYLLQIIPFHILPEIQKKIMRLIGEFSFRNKSQPKIDQLSDRKRNVLKYMSQLMPCKEIADRLNISENTVNFHKKDIRVLLELQSDLELVFYGLAYGFISNRPAYDSSSE